jgi:amino-acid N-acetyltransferase
VRLNPVAAEGLSVIELRPANDSEQAGIRAMLANSGLPVQDLATSTIDFIVAVADAQVVGVVGLEAFDGAGLLRSLAVEPERRDAGAGALLVQAVETLARDRGLQQLVLLTQTAEPFFARRGYAVIARGDAPESVRASSEFRSICPASATCMSKSLTP